MKLERQTMFKNIANLKFNAVFLYAMIFAAIFCPGLLAIYFYKFELFLELEVTKLILLSVAIDAPLFGWSLFLSMLLLYFDCRISRLYFSENQVYDIMLAASFQTFIILNTALSMSWVFRWDYHTFFNSLFFTSMFLALLVFITILRKKILDKKKDSTNTCDF